MNNVSYYDLKVATRDTQRNKDPVKQYGMNTGGGAGQTREALGVAEEPPP
jgi:hypothetical protein